MFLHFRFSRLRAQRKGNGFYQSRPKKDFLAQRGIASSYSLPFQPQGNPQCERTNQSVWKTVRLLWRSNDIPGEHYERVLPKALHSIRSLLSTATNQTPHERLLSFPWRVMFGSSMPSWLLNQGTVLLRRFVRNKEDPLCNPVELLTTNPTYARIKYLSGKESTVSTSDPRTISLYRSKEFWGRDWRYWTSRSAKAFTNVWRRRQRGWLCHTDSRRLLYPVHESMCRSVVPNLF